MADAEAICEAVTRASMRFVPTKTPEQQSCLMSSQKPSSLMTCRCGQVFDSHRLEDTLVHVPHISAAESEHVR
jgi:hypothetical protein